MGCLQEDDILLKDISRHFMEGLVWQYPMKNMYLEEEMVIYIPKQRPRFRRFEDQIEHVIDQELRKKVIQTAVSEMMLNPLEAERIRTIVRNILQRKTFRIQQDAVNNINRYIDSILRWY